VSVEIPQGKSARYIKIAVDIATCIARGEYREGQKILGRSSLAVLEERKIVKMQPGVGVIVCSHTAAENYLAEYGQRQILADIQKRLHYYLQERSKLDQKIAELTNELLEYTFKMATRYQRIHEFRVEENSPLIGKSLKETEFRALTGGTILSINRNGKEIVSPDANTIIEKNDILTVAPQESIEESRALNLTHLSGPAGKLTGITE